MKTFVAIEIGAEIQAQLAEAGNKARRVAKAVRWIRPEFTHLTLCFLGEMANAGVPAVSAAVEKAVAQHGPLNLVARGAGTFGSLNSPTVLWVSLSGDVPELMTLQRSVSGALVKIGHQKEYDSYEPHLTLGRSRNPRGDETLHRAAAVLRDLTFGAFRAEEVVVVESEDTLEGMRFAVISRHPLKGKR